MKNRVLAIILALCLTLLTGGAALAETSDNSASTTLYGSSEEKLNNLELAVSLLDGTSVYYGETFSFNTTIGPRTKERGFEDAMNGRGSEVLGGGVAQLATTLYLAARECDELKIEPFKAYGDRFRDWYVEDGKDAVITDYAAGTDFQFTSRYSGTIYISAWMDDYDLYVSLDMDSESKADQLVARASTPIFGSANKRNNIELAADSISGVCLERYDQFSFNDLVGPRTQDAGYQKALNGRGVQVVGGGVAQVASTVYLAVKELKNCVEMGSVRTYGKNFVDGYVSDSQDAIVTDYNADIDFSFTYTGYGQLRIELYEEDSRLVCEVYEE